MARAHNRVVLKGRNHHKEGPAGAAVLPGMDVSVAADGTIVPNAAARADAQKASSRVAKEDGLQGHTIAGTGYQGSTYNVGDPVFYYMPVNGCELNLLVKDGEVITKGDYLVSEGGGSGLFVRAIGADTHLKYQALETLTPTGANDFIAAEYQG